MSSSDTKYLAGMWTDQYPTLLPKNFLGIKRLWDQQHPLVTSIALPAQKTPFNFQWKIRINPGEVAPIVGEGARTPMREEYWTLEKFLCAEVREGFQVFERELGFGIPNIIAQRTEAIAAAVNLRQEWENLKAMVGSATRLNTDQVTTRLNSAAATATWDAAAALGAPLTDILTAIRTIEKMCGMSATHIFMGINEHSYLMDHGDILDQLKYVDPKLLTDGLLTVLKGLTIVKVTGFYKSDPAVFTLANKNFVLQDQVIVAACPVGFCGVAEGDGGPATPPVGAVIRAWDDTDSKTKNVQAFKSFTPVIEDYGKIYVITNTDSDVATAVPA